MKSGFSYSKLFVAMAAGCLLSPAQYAVAAKSVVSAPIKKIEANKLVTVYLLVGSSAELQRYMDDLSKIDKANFNRVIFSFVRPTMPNYESGNLANTGILGYFNEGDGKGVTAFQLLKQAVALSRSKNIQTFLSVGGWNYSCNPDAYGHACGPADEEYDWFPDPNDPAQKELAKKSYANLIKLTNDLGMDGVDFDYEEFWHADANALSWGGDPWKTDLANTINKAGGPSYQNLMEYGTKSGSTFVMPKTIEKVEAILQLLTNNPDAKDLKFATAAPPVGGRPVTGFVYGDNDPDIYSKGGLWWKGNLKGMWYHLNEKNAAIVSRFDSLGLMTYDICGDNPTLCAPYGGAKLDLASQVSAYMKDYAVWLKAAKPSAATLTVDKIGKVEFLPAKYNINSKIQFGFEVNKPAYPVHDSGKLQLTNELVDTITAQQKDSGGVIIWQMYSAQNTDVKGATTTQYTVQKSCETFLKDDARYDCSVHFPSAVSDSNNRRQ